MCEPITTTAGLALYSSLAATAVTAYGAYQQGQGQKKVAEYNAKVADVQAEDATNRGFVAADQQRARVRQIAGQQTAAMGASGTTVGEGTTGLVLDQTATMGELDARQIELNAQREAWGLRSQAAGARFSGALSEQAGTMGAVGSLITGGVGAYGIYDKYKVPRAGAVSNASSTMTQAQYYKR